MNRVVPLRNALVVGLLLALSVGAGPGEPSAVHAAGDDTVTIELRFWQKVYPDLWNDLRVWVSARPDGGRWDTLGTVPLEFGRSRGGAPDRTYAVLAIAGVELRISNHQYDMAHIRVYSCGSSCLDRADTHVCESPGDHVPLDDGYNRSGRYRYGDATIEVPRTNPRLLIDRERLLAMRDTLAGTGTLDWSFERPIEEWEGVSVAGSPPRVTKLDLTERGLTGELTGLLGDLTALSELRLDGNALSGRIPTKLTQLPRLARLYMDGNPLEGCVPASLRTIADTDINMLALPDCGTPKLVVVGSEEILTDGAYGPVTLGVVRSSLIFDVSAGIRLRASGVVMNGSLWFVIQHETGVGIVISFGRCGSRWILDGDLDAAAAEDMRRLVESLWWTEPD